MRDRKNKNNKNNKNNNRRKYGKNKENRDNRNLNLERDIELEELEDALLDQTSRIIDQLMTVITTRLKERGRSQEDMVNQSRLDHYKDNSTYERLYGNKSYMPPKENIQNINNQNQELNATQNVSMNIQRPRSMTDPINETPNMVLPGGAQLYPGQQYNHRQPQRPPRQQYPQYPQRQPRVQNRYQPTVGPGGRAEAPRDNVVIGSQALQYASRVANRIGSNQVSVGRNNYQLGQNRSQPVAPRTTQQASFRPPAQVARQAAPVARPMAPVARATVAPSGPVVAQAA